MRQRPGDQFSNRGMGQCQWRWLPQPAQRSPQRWAATLFIKRRRSGLLAQFVAVPVNSDGNMSIARRGKIEKALQINLPGGGVEQVAAAHDLRDPLIGIVHDDGQLIGKPAVSAADYEIAHFACQTLTAVALNGVS